MYNFTGYGNQLSNMNSSTCSYVVSYEYVRDLQIISSHILGTFRSSFEIFSVCLQFANSEVIWHFPLSVKSTLRPIFILALWLWVRNLEIQGIPHKWPSSVYICAESNHFLPNWAGRSFHVVDDICNSLAPVDKVMLMVILTVSVCENIRHTLNE